MHHCSNRREFLRRTAVAGACLGSFAPLSYAASALNKTDSSFATVHIVSGPAMGGETLRSPTWVYLKEILQRGGVFFEMHLPAEIEKLTRSPNAIVILAGSISLDARQRGALAEWVRQGGALLGIGGASGLQEVFGVANETPLAEAWMRVSEINHPMVSGLHSSLHVFGGHTLTPSTGAVLAGIQGGSAYVKGNAILENRFGKGRAVLVGPDLMFSIVHMQQGVPVLQDSKPPADGSALVNDGVLKAEDGSVLDWVKDRSAVQPEGSIFLEPIADELREIILRGILHLAREQGSSLPLLWQWPRSLKAVAMMSHDSDSNEPGKAVTLLDVVNRCNLKTTWCILYPGGYPRDFYRKLDEQGYEIALHYDAMSGGEKTSWSIENFLLQNRWLKETAGVSRITTNKNHYTRWEGRLDFWRWCEEAGIQSDQTRGPSKRGTIGFPLGGSQPYFPLDDSSGTSRFMKVLEVNLLTQDLVITCPQEYGRQLVDSTLRHNGVAHFLFHPAHIQKPGVAEALSGVVEYARSVGMEWWTNQQIVEWETSRRAVTAKHDRNELQFRTPKGLEDATLLFLRPGAKIGVPEVDGQSMPGKRWTLYGFDFDAVQPPLKRDLRLSRRPA